MGVVTGEQLCGDEDEEEFETGDGMAVTTLVVSGAATVLLLLVVVDDMLVVAGWLWAMAPRGAALVVFAAFWYSIRFNVPTSFGVAVLVVTCAVAVVALAPVVPEAVFNGDAAVVITTGLLAILATA